MSFIFVSSEQIQLLFVNLEKNLKEKGDYNLTFDEIINDVDKLKTIGSLEVFLINKFKK